MSLKVAYAIPHMALRDYGVHLDESAHSYAAATRQMCGRLGVEVHFTSPYAHHMLGKAEAPPVPLGATPLP
jgi:transposase InsO family protein